MYRKMSGKSSIGSWFLCLLPGGAYEIGRLVDPCIQQNMSGAGGGKRGGSMLQFGLRRLEDPQQWCLQQQFTELIENEVIKSRKTANLCAPHSQPVLLLSLDVA